MTDDHLEILRGNVLFHGPDCDELLLKARELKLDYLAVRYLGEYPEHFAINIDLFGEGIVMFEDAHMDETLTMEEIKARYAPDWVLIAEPETDDMQRLLRGKVVCHGPDGDELLRKATELKLDHIAVRYLGEWPEDMVFIL